MARKSHKSRLHLVIQSKAFSTKQLGGLKRRTKCSAVIFGVEFLVGILVEHYGKLKLARAQRSIGHALMSLLLSLRFMTSVSVRTCASFHSVQPFAARPSSDAAAGIGDLKTVSFVSMIWSTSGFSMTWSINAYLLKK